MIKLRSLLSTHSYIITAALAKFLLLAILVSVAFISMAQKPIKGNGRITTHIRTVNVYNRLIVDGSWAKVEIHCGKMPLIEITTDGNIHSFISTKLSGNILTISSLGKWIEPSNVFIKVYVPFLSHLHLTGWVDIKVFNLNSRQFTIVGDVGQISLAGSIDLLKVSMSQGKVDASKLLMKNLEADISSKHGWLLYLGTPGIVQKGEGHIYPLSP